MQNCDILFAVVPYNTWEASVKKTPWILAFLSLLIPLETMAQTQDIHALRVVTQAFDKAKSDNKIRRDTMIAQKVHRIENLRGNDEFVSVEKVAVYKAYTKVIKGKTEYVEELVDIWPAKADPPSNPLDFERLLDEFLIRSYFLISSETEVIDGRTCVRVHFWPRENLPPEIEDVDRILNRALGILYIDERTYTIRRINGYLEEAINVPFFYNMERLDFNIEFSNQSGLVLIRSIHAVTKYQYRPPRTLFRTIKRFQTHKFWYDYGNVQNR